MKYPVELEECPCPHKPGVHIEGCPGVARWHEILKAEREAPKAELPDLINHPPHYTGHPSGVECIQITEHMNFCVGNAIKYLWRAGKKSDAIPDLEKARWYVDREIERVKTEWEKR